MTAVATNTLVRFLTQENPDQVVLKVLNPAVPGMRRLEVAAGH